MALVLARVVIVIPFQLEAAKDALHRQPFPALANFSRLGLIDCLRAIHGLLEQPPDQRLGRAEYRRANQDLQLGDSGTL